MDREWQIAAVGSLVLSAVITPIGPLGIPTVAHVVLSLALLVTAFVAWRDYINIRPVPIVFVWFITGFAWWLPEWQTLIYYVLVANPNILQWIVIGAVIIGLSYVFGKRNPHLEDNVRGGIVVTIHHNIKGSPLHSGLFGLAVFVMIVGTIFVGPTIGGFYMQEDLGKDTFQSAEKIDELPESPEKRSRIVPLSVAENWADSSMQQSRYKVADECDITFLNRTPHWSCGVEPQGPRNTFLEQQNGAIYVNQSSFERDVIVESDESFENGMGMAITDDYRWNLKTNRYLVDYRPDSSFVVPGQDQSYIATPWVRHEWRFRVLPIPHVYAVPQQGGVALTPESGSVEYLSPQEAATSPVLEDQNFYPYGLARTRIQATSYRNGIVNTLPIGKHTGQISLAEIPGEDNDQPFTVPTKDQGPVYFAAAEPWNSGGAVREIWVMDGQTGEPQLFKVPGGQAWKGARKSVQSIDDYREVARLNDVKTVEPVPVVRAGTLYWQGRVIPESSSRMTYVAFYNAQTENITLVENTEDTQVFLAEREINDTQTGVTDPSGGDTNGTEVVVVIKNEDGEVIREVPVGQNQTITVEQRNP